MNTYFSKIMFETLNLPKLDTDNVNSKTNNTMTILLFVIVSMSFMIMIGFGLVAWKIGKIDIVIMNSICAVIYLSILILLSTRINSLILSYIYAAVLGSQFLYLIYSGGLSGFGYVWTLLFPLGTLFFLGIRKGITASIIFLFLAIILLFSYSYYAKFGFAFHLRYISIYLAVMIISSTYESIKDRLNISLLSKNKELEQQIAEIKKKDKLLLQAKEKAERADKIKSEFLAQMSHEIRTPVNTIFNYTWLIREELNAYIDESVENSFTTINEASKRLLRTIDMILDISSLEAGLFEPHFENIELSKDIITSLFNEFNQTAKYKGLVLFTSIQNENGYKIFADRYTLTQAIANLIDNAIKYTNRGNVTISVNYHSDYCDIKIIDTGIGISEEYLPRLFDKFTQESEGYSRIYEGNGLGLALVKKYCELNKAEISVESTKNVGTTFTICLKATTN